MRLIPLLGKQLKDDEVIDLLDCLDMEVIYDFDKLREGQPDKYWASSKEAGIQLRFDAAQALDAVFFYIATGDGFTAFSQSDCDVPLFASIAEAQAFGDAQHLQLTNGRADFLGVPREWVRLGFPAYASHYEFHGGRLALVTITRSDN